MTEKLAEKKETSLRALVESDAFKSQVAKALPKHLTPDRFIRVACTAMMKTPKLMDCTQVSFFNALLSLSQLGLEPDGRRAHLIPFGNDCQLIVDYKGLVELAMRSGNVSNIHADVVCDNDVFIYDRGQITQHTIDFKNKRGNVYAAYATVKFKDGSEKTEVLSKEDIEAVRSRSKAGKSGPWVTDWNEMAKKSAFRRLSKWIILSPEYHDILERDFDSFEPLNQPSAKGMIPPPPLLVQQTKQNFEDIVTITTEPEPEKKKPEKPASNPATEQEPPADAGVEPEIFDELDKMVKDKCAGDPVKMKRLYKKLTIFKGDKGDIFASTIDDLRRWKKGIIAAQKAKHRLGEWIGMNTPINLDND